MSTESTAVAPAENATQHDPPLATIAAADDASEHPTSSSSNPLKTPAAPSSEQTNNPASSSTSKTNTAPPTTNIEFEPPAACIRRLLKSVLPKSTNVSKDSLAAISRASGIFVLYLTACANDVARESRRSTIVAKDVLGALAELEFDEFVPLMEKFLEGHRKDEKSKKEEKERLKKIALEREGEEGGIRDVATGKFVPKEDAAGKEGGVERVIGKDGEDAAAVDTVNKGDVDSPKHAREDEGGGNMDENEGEQSAKKLKVATDNEDQE